ncbi:hypothetical protein Afil01_59190 [Actinorhabdospora filicis]|uniref:Uncharacterized protein n=1 Tax=Actinorhabdospora filicis TaxID=1785913 RepID=A0A9W6W642_9ACTN|nr:hypothetical protein [Actinorhabdospora filicis]GLZ81112.1 hypothetical protein Afil01_59190 [Actinorhabdospora filicis]
MAEIADWPAKSGLVSDPSRLDEHVVLCAGCGEALSWERVREGASFLIPFDVDGRRAVADWVKSRWLAPEPLRRGPHEPVALHVPVWSVSARTTTRYRGERGVWHERVERHTQNVDGRDTEREHTVRSRSWAPVGSSFDLPFHDIRVPAVDPVTAKVLAELGEWPDAVA